ARVLQVHVRSLQRQPAHADVTGNGHIQRGEAAILDDQPRRSEGTHYGESAPCGHGGAAAIDLELAPIGVLVGEVKAADIHGQTSQTHIAGDRDIQAGESALLNRQAWIAARAKRPRESKGAAGAGANRATAGDLKISTIVAGVLQVEVLGLKR